MLDAPPAWASLLHFTLYNFTATIHEKLHIQIQSWFRTATDRSFQDGTRLAPDWLAFCVRSRWFVPKFRSLIGFLLPQMRFASYRIVAFLTWVTDLQPITAVYLMSLEFTLAACCVVNKHALFFFAFKSVFVLLLLFQVFLSHSVTSRLMWHGRVKKNPMHLGNLRNVFQGADVSQV